MLLFSLGDNRFRLHTSDSDSQNLEEIEMLKPLCTSLGALLVTASVAAPAPVLAQDTINLKFHSSFGEAGLNMAARWWMDEIEKRTDGKVKFERIFGGPLGKLAGAPTAIKAGSFDVGQVSAVYNPGLYRRGTLTVLPFLSDDVLAHSKAAHELFNDPEVNQEFTALNQKYMFPGMWATIEMMSYDPARTIEDLGKMKIRAHGGSADILKALGMTPYAIPWGELPAAAERRVVDAAIMGAPTDAYDFGFGDIFSYWSRIKWYYFPLSFVMNMDTWNSLPEDVQKTMEELNAEMPEQTYALYNAREMESEKALIDGGLVEVVAFEELDELKEARRVVWDQWVADRNAEGIDGQAVLDQFLALVSKYE